MEKMIENYLMSTKPAGRYEGHSLCTSAQRWRMFNVVKFFG